jgi:PAS domain-containing protein
MQARARDPTPEHDILVGSSDMNARAQAHDWSSTPLGDPASWPQSLRSYVSMVLSATQPMVVSWGPELTFVYNDAYAPILGKKHPRALGRPFAEVWSDIWEQISPLVERTLAGEASFHEDLLIPMERHGYRENAWFTFSYTPLRDESGRVAGMLGAIMETTDKVIAERRVASEGDRLRRLFQQAPGIICVLRGPDHVFEMANDSYLQLVGHRNLVGKPAVEALPEVRGQGFIALLDTVNRTGRPFIGQQLRVTLQRTSGAPVEERFVNFIYQPVTDENGEVTGIFVEGSDVTEAKFNEGIVPLTRTTSVEQTAAGSRSLKRRTRSFRTDRNAVRLRIPDIVAMSRAHFVRAETLTGIVARRVLRGTVPRGGWTAVKILTPAHARLMLAHRAAPIGPIDP